MMISMYTLNQEKDGPNPLMKRELLLRKLPLKKLVPQPTKILTRDPRELKNLSFKDTVDIIIPTLSIEIQILPLCMMINMFTLSQDKVGNYPQMRKKKLLLSKP